MKQTHVGNLVLDYDDQTKLAEISSVILKTSDDEYIRKVAEGFMDYVGDNLAPEEG